jgi:preprotein translocase subunit YajC
MSATKKTNRRDTMENEIKVGTEVVSGGLRGIVTRVKNGDAWITWETGRYYLTRIDRIRSKSAPANVQGIATVRIAKGANRLQGLLND